MFLLLPRAADLAPDALQRTSDERWLTLRAFKEEQPGRWRLAVAEDDSVLAVSHRRPPGDAAEYAACLRVLLGAEVVAPPGVSLCWPTDLLHDLDGVVVGYVHPRAQAEPVTDLEAFADPALRPALAPAATWQHRLRAARNACAAVGALHLAGVALGGARLRVDDRARVTVDDCDRLDPSLDEHSAARERAQLGGLVARLLAGGLGPVDTDPLARLLVAARTGDVPYPGQWITALRAAERALVACDADPLHVHGSALPRCPWCKPAPVVPRADAAAPAADQIQRGAVSGPRAYRIQHGAGSGPGAPPADTPDQIRHDGGFVPEVGRIRQRGGSGPVTVRGRATFAIAFAVAAAGAASIAPFAVYVAALAALLLWAIWRAVARGHRRSALRIVPAYLGSGVAAAAFIFLDLVLLFGLLLAVAEQVFGYGPGFRITLPFDVPQVPGLLRAFAATVAGLAALGVGGPLHDAVLTSRRRPRLLALPATAIAVGILVAAIDAPVVWWPFPVGALAAL